MMAAATDSRYLNTGMTSRAILVRRQSLAHRLSWRASSSNEITDPGVAPLDWDTRSTKSKMLALKTLRVLSLTTLLARFRHLHGRGAIARKAAPYRHQQPFQQRCVGHGDLDQRGSRRDR